MTEKLQPLNFGNDLNGNVDKCTISEKVREKLRMFLSFEEGTKALKTDMHDRCVDATFTTECVHSDLTTDVVDRGLTTDVVDSGLTTGEDLYSDREYSGYILGEGLDHWPESVGCQGYEDLEMDPHYILFGCNTESQVPGTS